MPSRTDSTIQSCREIVLCQPDSKLTPVLDDTTIPGLRKLFSGGLGSLWYASRCSYILQFNLTDREQILRPHGGSFAWSFAFGGWVLLGGKNGADESFWSLRRLIIRLYFRLRSIMSITSLPLHLCRRPSRCVLARACDSTPEKLTNQIEITLTSHPEAVCSIHRHFDLSAPD